MIRQKLRRLGAALHVDFVVQDGGLVRLFLQAHAFAGRASVMLASDTAVYGPLDNQEVIGTAPTTKIAITNLFDHALIREILRTRRRKRRANRGQAIRARWLADPRDPNAVFIGRDYLSPTCKRRT